MKNLTDIFLKARSGVYKDTSENRRLHRVGQKYGESKQPEDDEKDKKEVDPAKELEAVNKVIEAINNKQMTLPPDQIMVLIEKKNKLELAKKQAEKINAGVKANEEKKNLEEAKKISKKINEAQKKDSEKKDSLSKESLNNSGDGSEIKITNAQTGNPVISFTKKDGKWYGKNTMTRGEVKYSPEEMLRTLERYNRKLYVRKMNLLSDSKETKEEAIQRVNEKYKRLSKDHSDYISRFGAAVGPDLAELQRAKRIELQKIEDRFAEKEKQVSSLKEDLDHQNNELDNLEEKEELDEDGELVTITHDKDKFKRYRLYRDLRSARMKRGTSPELAELGYLKNSGDINKKGIEKYFELQKEFGDKKYDFKEKSGEEPKEETKESFTRVKFDDLPNSGKVNLKKYLSDKVKRTADENLGILSKVSTENLKKMEAGLVKEFNSQFDDLPKSRRAEKLYSIMKVKAELAQRGNKG